MPLTSLLGWKQLSIAVLLLFAPASCTALLMIQRDFDSRFAGLNIKVDHTSDNNTLNLQQVTLAQLNTWRVDSQFAELAGNFAACCRMRTFLRNPSKGQAPCASLSEHIVSWTIGDIRTERTTDADTVLSSLDMYSAAVVVVPGTRPPDRY